MNPDELQLLSKLLDQGMDLPVLEREPWLGSLQGEAARLVPTLRDLLAREASHETADLIHGAPAFTAGALAGEGQLVGPYKLLRELGHGGMGAVWLAERVGGGPRRKVALKLPHVTWATSLAERFARESEILATLEHPNIARLYEAGVDASGRPFMALEYVEGVAIDAYCRDRKLDVPVRLALLIQVAEAVSFAHTHLVVHRDLKPANILVTEEGQVRLLDFGIAKLVEDGAAVETRLTQAGGRALTPDYASPEQILGRPIGTTSDVYSLGVVAFEILSGERPYRLKRGTAAEVEEAIVAADAPLASAVARDPAARPALRGDLDAILNKALKKDAAARYPSAAALAEDWRRHLRHEPVSARPDSLAYRVGRFARRNRAPVAAATFATVALVGGLVTALWQADNANRERIRALALVERNEGTNAFLTSLLTQAARGGQGLTTAQVLERGEQMADRELAGSPEVRANVLGILGTNLQTLGQPKQGVRLLERSLEAAKQGKDQELIDRLTAQHAFALGWSGRRDEALATLRNIASRDEVEIGVRAEAHHYLASLASSASDAKAQVEHATEALRLHRSSPRPSKPFETSLLASVGVASFLNGRPEEGDRSFGLAIEKLEALKLMHSPHAITIVHNWSVMNFNAGDTRQALALSDKVLELRASDAASLRSPFEVVIRGAVLEAMGMLEKADAAYAEAAALANSLGNEPVAVRAALARASICLTQGRGEEADRFIGEAVRANGGRAPPFGSFLQARRAAVRGDDAAAREGFDAAMRAKDLVNPPMALLGLSDLHLRQGRPDEALAKANEALGAADRARGGKPFSFRSGLAHLAIARAQVQRGDAASARTAAELALRHLRPMVDASHPALAEAESLSAHGKGPAT